MKIQKFLDRGRGDGHYLHCEDYLSEFDIDDKIKLFAVFDGCSTGKDAFFASKLFALLLRKLSSEIKFEEEKSLNEYTEEIFSRFFKKLNETVQSLGLSKIEILSTLILAIIDTNTSEYKIVAAGDGLVLINGKLTEIDQNNMPDYPAYHLDTVKDKKTLKLWLEKNTRQFGGKGFNNIVISTDGVLSYFNTKEMKALNFYDVSEFLFEDLRFMDNPAGLARKHKMIKRDNNVENNDDIGIIRIYKSEKES